MIGKQVVAAVEEQVEKSYVKDLSSAKNNDRCRALTKTFSMKTRVLCNLFRKDQNRINVIYENMLFICAFCEMPIGEEEAYLI